MSLDFIDHELVFIKWKDAVGTASRFDSESLASLSLVVNINVGWIAHENEHRIVLVSGVSTSGEVDALVIPLGDIIERIPAPGKKGKGKGKGK